MPLPMTQEAMPHNGSRITGAMRPVRDDKNRMKNARDGESLRRARAGRLRGKRKLAVSDD